MNEDYIDDFVDEELSARDRRARDLEVYQWTEALVQEIYGDFDRMRIADIVVELKGLLGFDLPSSFPNIGTNRHDLRNHLFETGLALSKVGVRDV